MYKRLALLFAIDSLLLTPFRTFGSLYFLTFMSSQDVGKLFTLSNIGRVLGTLAAGLKSSKKVIVSSFILSIVFYVLLFFNPRIFFPIASFFRSWYVVVTDVAVYEHAPEEDKTFAYGISLSFSDVSYIAALLAYSFFFGNDLGAIRLRIYLLAIPSIIAGIALLSGVHVRPSRGKLLEPVSDRRISVYLLLVSIYRLLAPLIFIFGVPLVNSKGLTATDISYILSLTAFLEIFLAPALSKLAKATTLYAVGQSIRLTSRMLIATLNDKLLISALYTAAVMMYALIGPASGAMDAGIMPESSRTEGISLIRLSTAATFTVGSYIAGYVYAFLGPISFLIYSVMMLILAFVIAEYVRKNRSI